LEINSKLTNKKTTLSHLILAILGMLLIIALLPELKDIFANSIMILTKYLNVKLETYIPVEILVNVILAIFLLIVWIISTAINKNKKTKILIFVMLSILSSGLLVKIISPGLILILDQTISNVIAKIILNFSLPPITIQFTRWIYITILVILWIIVFSRNRKRARMQ
jgi:hypothetical protein